MALQIEPSTKTTFNVANHQVIWEVLLCSCCQRSRAAGVSNTTLQQMVWGHQMLLVPCITLQRICCNRRPTANSNQQPSRPSKFYRKGEKTHDGWGCIWGNQHLSENTRNEVVESKNSFKHLYSGNKTGCIHLDGQKAPITSMTFPTNLGVL